MRLRSVGKQADAMLKMLTVLHRMQLHSPAFAATLLSSSLHGKSLEAIMATVSSSASQFAGLSTRMCVCVCVWLWLWLWMWMWLWLWMWMWM